MLARHPHECPFEIVVGINELNRMSPHLPSVVAYIVRNRPCVYDLLYNLFSCREDTVCAMDAPYVCRL